MNASKNLIGSFLIAIAAFGVWGFGVPAYDQISALRSAIEERQATLTQRQQIIANIQNINAEYQRRSTDIRRLSLIVPQKRETAEVVSALQDISSKNGLQMIGISINEQKSTNNADPYDMLSIDLNVSGSYLSLLNFLASIEKNIRLIDIVQIDAGQPSTQQIINFRIKANAYFLKNING